MILDRDGVVNYDSKEFIKSPDEWIPIPGSLEAIARLNHAGYHVVIASNQSAIGRGLCNIDTLNAIHEKMHRALELIGGRIDAIFFCPHTSTDYCNCRKPKPGLFMQISQRFKINPTSILVVGDSRHDMQAASAVGCSQYLVLTGNGYKTLGAGDLPVGTTVYSNLHTFSLDCFTTAADRDDMSHAT